MTSTLFSPAANAVFAFQATLDGQIYNVTVPWNISRQDWYVKVTDQSNKPITNVPRIGSPDPPQSGVNLVGGYFTISSMYYYPSSQTFVVTP